MNHDNYDDLWREIDSNLASNYFIQNKNSIDNISDDNDVWQTPRASWRSTSDGYIEALELEKSLKSFEGYSRIKKPQKYDKIFTTSGDNNCASLTYNSQITLSYNKVRNLLTIFLNFFLY